MYSILEINSLKVEGISRNSAKFVFTKDLQQRFGISFVNRFTKEIPKRCCKSFVKTNFAEFREMPSTLSELISKMEYIFCSIFSCHLVYTNCL